MIGWTVPRDKSVIACSNTQTPGQYEHLQHVPRLEGETIPWGGIPGQERTQQDVRANRGRTITRTDDGDEVVEWRFEEILDYGKADNGRWQYFVKWEGKGHALTWQPATDLRGCDDAI